MIEPRFNALIHSPVRLRICALLRHTSELEFATIRDTLDVTDAHLSTNLKLLSDTEIVQLRKRAKAHLGGADEGGPGHGRRPPRRAHTARRR